MVSNSCLLLVLVAVSVVVITTAQDCHYCSPGSNCWPTLQQLSDLNTTLDGDVITAENSIYKYVLLDFSLPVKPATLIFISGRGSAISSAKQGKSAYIYNLVKNR